MNPNKALWEKGDFTRIAESMRESGDELVSKLGVTQGHEGPRSRLRRRNDRLAGSTSSAPTCSGSISRRTWSRPGTGAPRRRAWRIAAFKKATPPTCAILRTPRFDLVVSIFGAMFAPKPFDVAKEMTRVTRPGGRIVMGNWIPNDPTLVAQILKISSAYSPPPPEGFVSPMTWGIESNVIERFGAAGVPKDSISFVRDTYTFRFASPPAQLVDAFRKYYGPTMNAFDAAEKNGRSEELKTELDDLFNSQNKSPVAGATVIPATYLRVAITR